MRSVSAFYLANNGGFVCFPRIQYIDQNGNKQLTPDTGQRLDINQNSTITVAQYNIPAGCFGQIYIDIIWGDDRTGGTYFLLDQSANATAMYNITGTTLDSSVHFNGVST